MLTLQDPAEAQPHLNVAASPVVAIVGATGAVGVELLHCLEARNFPLSRLRLLASPAPPAAP
ncbi:hypothetical protein [Teichococcus aestuarii]|uniref:hypothetical protein n=1 Tax=Teichococcus aestuarii TaxID=568898 RepID=UPI00360C629B